MKKNIKNIIKEVAKKKAINIINFFFNQIIGKPVYNHLSLLIQLYNKYNNNKLDKGLFKRANKAVKNTKHTTLKHFFVAIGAVTKASRLNNSII